VGPDYRDRFECGLLRYKNNLEIKPECRLMEEAFLSQPLKQKIAAQKSRAYLHPGRRNSIVSNIRVSATTLKIVRVFHTQRLFTQNHHHFSRFGYVVLRNSGLIMIDLLRQGLEEYISVATHRTVAQCLYIM
jgi:hypothetical protein